MMSRPALVMGGPMADQKLRHDLVLACRPFGGVKAVDMARAAYDFITSPRPEGGFAGIQEKQREDTQAPPPPSAAGPGETRAGADKSPDGGDVSGLPDPGGDGGIGDRGEPGHPAPAPVPGCEDPPLAAEGGSATVKNGTARSGSRQDELTDLMMDGLTAAEIADKTGLQRSSIRARATQWGLTAAWRTARESKKSPAPPPPKAAPSPFTHAATAAKRPPPDRLAEKQKERAFVAQAMAASPVEITKVATPVDHPGGRVPLETVILFLRNEDEIMEINKGQWLVNGMETLSARQLVERANRRRKRQRRELFELDP